MKLYIAADHRGYTLKETLRPWLAGLGHEVIDCGNSHLDPQDDYTDFGITLARQLASDLSRSIQALGIGICGSGVGISIAANRIRGVRCALSLTSKHIQHARQNDHVNVLSLASEYLTEDEAKEIITTFLTTEPIRQEKYIRRARVLDQLS